MSMGTVRIEWIIDGETVKDETAPYTMQSITQLEDGAVMSGGLGLRHEVTVRFTFDPPLAPQPTTPQLEMP